MSSKVVEIIREYVLQTLAQQGSIPFRITQTQYRAATESVIQCLESASSNRDATPRVIQREATLLALQTIPRAIAEASTQLDDGPSPPPTGPPDSNPAEDETSIDDLVQRELARRQEQDAAMGVIPPVQPDSNTPPNTRELDTPAPIPTPMDMSTFPTQPASIPLQDNLSNTTPLPRRDIRPTPTNQPTNQPTSQPATQSNNTITHTIAIPHNPEETSPIRIRYTPSQPDGQPIQVDRVIMPIWVRGEDSPFIVCSVMGVDIYLFPSSMDPRILIPRPHQLPPNHPSGDMVFTFHKPDGELIDTNGERTGMINIQKSDAMTGVFVNARIRHTLSGVRIKFKDDDEYRERVYPFTDDTSGLIRVPLPENEAPIESALGHLRSPWAISLFLTTQTTPGI